VDVSVSAEGGWVALRVTDTGEGIDEADVARIWGRFYRGEKSRRRGQGGADGAGLGLAIVKSVVEAHGGSVDVRSVPHQGASFSVRLPCTGRT
jgi:two-component system OmpR family sensor kinase